MVSTRGGARTSAPDAEMTLKKKTVRKTTAKTTIAAASKPRATRAKKAEPHPEPEMEDGEDELAEPTPAPTKPATRRGRPAAKKDEKPAKKAPVPKTTMKAAAAPETATKATRTATTRNTKVKVTEDEQTEVPPQLKKAPELKPSQSRATRPTRATAAKEKAAPLSPKKITQVSKVPLKKTTTAKSATVKNAPAKPTTRGGPATRKRNISDENAGVPELKGDAEEDEEAIDAQQTASVKTKTPKQPSPQAVVLDNETPMSTRPSTPANSTQQTIDEPELDTEEAQDEESVDELQAEDGSDDELCAPKTPMKRCDPREQAKYSPAEGTQLPDVDVRLRTPVRRFHVLGTQQGTPQTQKPYCKPTVPMSEVRPMTVARARDTAMVFPTLQPLRAAKISSIDATPLPAQRQEVNMEHAAGTFAEQDSDMSLFVDASTQDIPISDVTEVFENSGLDDTEQAHPARDPDETTAEEELDENSSDSQRDASLDSINSVLVTRREASICDESEDDSGEVNEVHTTPRPETMAWENLREDITIPFEFDDDASPTRTLPQGEATERLSIAMTFVSKTRNRGTAFDIAFNPGLSVSRQSIGEVRESLDATLNISDFVDVSAITEQTDTDMADAEADVETVMAKNPTVQDTADDTSAVDGDITLMCNEPSMPLPATRTPVRLTTAEDVAEDSAAVDGDTTLLLDEPTCPATARRSPVKLTTAEDFFEDDDSIVNGDMTLAIDEPTCPRTIRRSPVRLTMAEDVPDESKTVEGEMTLMLNSPLPQQPETPALLNETRDSNMTPLDLEAVNTPCYARSTISSRRKSVSESSSSTTADSERLPVNTQPTTLEAWFDKVDSPARGKPRHSRPGTAEGSRSRSRSASQPRTPAARTPAANNHASVKSTLKERFPVLPAQQSYEALIGTPAAKSAVKERFPGMPPAESYQELLNSPALRTPSITQTPSARTPVTRAAALKRKALHDEEFEMPEAPSLQQAHPERFPGMPSRPTYEAHTAMPATRFRTPTRQSPIKRPATTRKATPLRKIALKAASTPMKAPLKAPAETPGQVPMTPHPSAPLRNVIALVDVYTHDGVCASQSFVQLLKRLGAKTTKTFNENVTHVVFKEGGLKLLQALKIHNKQVAECGKGQEIFCVNSRWVNDCDTKGCRIPESDEEYAVELDDYQRTAKRRRKSMEPMSLLKTNGGNIIRDRKSSGRVSIGRASMKGVLDSPEETSMFNVADKENSEDGSEPATPAYLKEPSALIQQTVPAKKMHKLDFGNESKQRRLTFADGLEF